MLNHNVHRQCNELVEDIDRWVSTSASGGSKVFSGSQEVFDQLKRFCAASLKKYRQHLSLNFQPPNHVEVGLSSEALEASQAPTLMRRGSSPKKRPAMAASKGGRSEPASKRRVVTAPRPQRSEAENEVAENPPQELTGMKVYLSTMLKKDQEDMARDFIPALGGSIVERPEEATHAVFPEDGQLKLQADWEECWPFAERAYKAKGHVVSNQWLKAVLEDAKRAQKNVLNYMPDFFKQKIAHGDAFQSRESRPPLRVQRSKAPDQSDHFARSLQQTLNQREEEELQRAIAASLEDFAVCAAPNRPLPSADRDEAAKVLGIKRGASIEEVKAAYKRKARASHPDKGGSTEDFGRVRHAYFTLMGDASILQAGQEGTRQLQESESCDFELRDHRAMVRELFEKDGVNLELAVRRQLQALEAMELTPKNLGAVNQNERGEDIYNQCFYLALARSYLGTDSDSLKDTALHFKRAIETAVLQAHPEWGGSRVGEDVQAFSDFLFYVLGSHALLSELSVAVFDSTSGGVELYIGRHYPSGADRGEEQRSNLLTLRYLPGHYEALVGQRRPRLDELQETLEKHQVPCVPTKV